MTNTELLTISLLHPHELNESHVQDPPCIPQFPIHSIAGHASSFTRQRFGPGILGRVREPRGIEVLVQCAMCIRNCWSLTAVLAR